MYYLETRNVQTKGWARGNGSGSISELKGYCGGTANTDYRIVDESGRLQWMDLGTNATTQDRIVEVLVNAEEREPVWCGTKWTTRYKLASELAKQLHVEWSDLVGAVQSSNRLESLESGAAMTIHLVRE